MEVAGLTIDASNNAPVVILREQAGSRVLPIWVGVVEASAIAFALEHVSLARPMTHDLLKLVLESGGGKVERVAITGLQDNSYIALITIRWPDRVVDVDARPSDAIALAVRTEAPIYCDAQVLDQVKERQIVQQEKPKEAAADDTTNDGPRPIVISSGRSYQEVLENLEPEAFGRYMQ